MLLEFSVSNFRCFRDEAHLSLTRHSLTTLQPRTGQSWQSVTFPVAAIYGANASGKSTLLDALGLLTEALQGHRLPLYDPYLLGQVRPSTTYLLDFVHDGRRFRYRVEARAWGIAREELWEVRTRWSKVFVRTQSETHAEIRVETGSTLRGASTEVRRITTSQDLFLATAWRYGHTTLAPLGRELARIRSIHHADAEREARLRWVVDLMTQQPDRWNGVTDHLARAADLGIAHVGLEEREIPPEIQAHMKRVAQAISEGLDVEVPVAMSEEVQRSLLFFHRGSDGVQRPLRVDRQSQGTQTWLATVGPAVETVLNGGVLVVDELDASLHPALTALLVEMFKDTDLNGTGAQLIFSTHDVSLLDNSPAQVLESGEVWMTEKGSDGASELFSLADFTDLRRASNKQRRYLMGAFGAVPRADMTDLRRAVKALGGVAS